MANATVKEITSDVVRFEVPGTGDDAPPELRELNADTVIVASGLEGNPDAIKAFEGLAPQVEVIGDCTGVTYLEGAIHDGFAAGGRV